MSTSYGFILILVAIFQLFIIIRAQQENDITSPENNVLRDVEGTDYELPPVVTSDDESLTDQICGTHPLKTIVKKIENTQPDMNQQAVIRLLALMRLRAPKMWNSYQQMLAAYMNCKVMSAGGSLG